MCLLRGSMGQPLYGYCYRVALREQRVATTCDPTSCTGWWMSPTEQTGGPLFQLPQPRQPVSTQNRRGTFVQSMHSLFMSHIASRLSELGLANQKQLQALQGR